MDHLPCPAANTDACPIYRQEGECYEDKHHKYWPASEYSTRTEKRFRQLESSKVVICRWIHNEIHSIVLPPEHPSITQMRKSVNEAPPYKD